eukprot:CAMPEP_0179929058 /NCGR_PEP_ID=MMETSP0983-20121128/9207_1 /TAXON_ID=483367 /ORGANISM="non described non described, Strain CCMP 2436" /LENGTH=150 /DNA_ID=CAMNT_0021832921 /DNA_START=33 /DNA_END=481 /DNA_ORIENTATION=+
MLFSLVCTRKCVRHQSSVAAASACHLAGCSREGRGAVYQERREGGGGGDEDGHHALAEPLVREAHDRRLEHGGVRGEGCDLARFPLLPVLISSRREERVGDHADSQGGNGQWDMLFSLVCARARVPPYSSVAAASACHCLQHGLCAGHMR